MKKSVSIMLLSTIITTSITLGTVKAKLHSDSNGNKTVLLNNPQQKMKPVVKEVYTCEMHPEVLSDKPGKCPKCKMDLVKKETSAVVYTCPMHHEVLKDKPGKCPKCKMDLVKKETSAVVYTCPMHHEVLKDKPGKCPKCKMDLVKKETAKK